MLRPKAFFALAVLSSLAPLPALGEDEDGYYCRYQRGECLYQIDLNYDEMTYSLFEYCPSRGTTEALLNVGFSVNPCGSHTVELAP